MQIYLACYRAYMKSEGCDIIKIADAISKVYADKKITLEELGKKRGGSCWIWLNLCDNLNFRKDNNMAKIGEQERIQKHHRNKLKYINNCNKQSYHSFSFMLRTGDDAELIELFKKEENKNNLIRKLLKNYYGV